MNTLKKARERVVPKLSHRRAAQALGMGLATLVRREAPSFDPADLSTRELEAMAALYQVAPAVLLGRAPFPERASLAEAV